MIFVLTRVDDVSGTHFRGGSISWAPVGNSGTQIEVHYRFGWKLNYEPHYLCTDDAIKNETMIEGEGELMLVKRSSEGDVLFEEIVKDPLDYICTDRFDEGSVGEFHWASGVNSFILDVDERMGTEFELGYFSCCWIGVLNYERPRRWKMLTKVDLTPRPDNQQLNSSPMTSSLPLLRIQRGCDFIVDIPYYDKDGDHVKCRWAKALKNECTPPNCGRAHQMFTITDGSCMIHIDSEVADIGWYAVAVMIEDFITPFSSQALSAVPFHFLVRVDPGERRCNDVINTDPVNKCLAVPPGELFVYKATAKVMNPKYHGGSIAMDGGSLAIGGCSVAMGGSSVAMCGYSIATGGYSIAMDGGSIAIGGCSVSMAGGSIAMDAEGFVAVGRDQILPKGSDSIDGKKNYCSFIFRSIRIVNFASTSPRGMEKSGVTSEGGGLYSAEFNWVPSPKLVGTVETFCYSPFDSERFSGNEVCIDLAIGGVRPFPKTNESIPGSETFSLSESVWQIAFDQEVTFNPDVTGLVTIIDTSNEEVVFNVTTGDVNADVEFNILVLTFWEPLVNILEENHVYELEVWPGIVNGTQLCMLPSTGASWTFNTCVQPFPDSARSVPSSSPDNALSVLDFYWNITFYHPVYLRPNISLIAQILDRDGIFLYNITKDDVTLTASDSNVISFLTPQWLYLEEASMFIGGRRPPPTILDPKVSVLCFPTFMEIFIARDQFGLEMDPAVITLDDEYCYGMEHNDTHFRLGTTYGQCDTKTLMNKDDSRVSMVNHVTIPSRAFPDESFNPYFPPLTPTPTTRSESIAVYLVDVCHL
ncbi:hypothetical protein BSL78_02527 [Apostichopus japonicus]|uniref:Uncharacterized protein n=1 Tax=Stichopus japonicus TaxID=307972 RepID=A0A2G8LK15_STIJA|nr:hypothetical protein BSL78_02527 [Apostichopus japonicus]